MKLQNIAWFLFIALLAGMLAMCSKPSEPEFDNPYDKQSDAFIPHPELVTLEVNSVRALEAWSGGEFTNDYGSPVTAKGVCWSTEENPTIDDVCTNNGQGLGAFESHLDDLEPDQQYYVRAYATSEGGTVYGDQQSMKTRDGRVSLLTDDATEITPFSAIVEVHLEDDGGAEVIRWGLCYDRDESPTVEANCLQEHLKASISLDSAVDGTVSKVEHSLANKEQDMMSLLLQLEDLEPNQRYYVRSFAENLVGISYGPEITFSTDAGIAQVTTRAVDDITHEGARSGGTVADEGGSPVNQRGVCWSTSQNPTTNDDCTTDGTGTGSFTSSLSNLQPETRYYVRAYASNNQGTAYGNQRDFTTEIQILLPSVNTSAISSITETSAQSGGNVSDHGGASVTARGVCWSTTQNPTTSDDCTSDGSGTGSFNSNLTNLDPDTQYYVRAYATNSEGTAYGNQRDFTTDAKAGLPSISTSSISSITETSAQSGGNVSDDGGASVTARGVCWSTSQNPKTSDDCTSDGSGTGSFTSNLSSLNPDTKYYVRAFATNSEGTAYGNQRNFTTLASVPDTPSLSSPANGSEGISTSPTLQWNASDGATSYDVRWSTNSSFNAANNDNVVDNIKELEDLSYSTTYYWSVRARNNAGISSWSSIWSFTTESDNIDYTVSGDFALTKNVYPVDSNWDQIVEDVIGSEYRVADWNDLVEYHESGNDLLIMLDELGVTTRGTIGSVTRNGSKHHTGSRYYFAARHEHQLPSGWAAFENIDNFLVSLGSWYGERRILAIRK